jgi:hypothetical protein
VGDFNTKEANMEVVAIVLAGIVLALAGAVGALAIGLLFYILLRVMVSLVTLL